MRGLLEWKCRWWSRVQELQVYTPLLAEKVVARDLFGPLISHAFGGLLKHLGLDEGCFIAWRVSLEP